MAAMRLPEWLWDATADYNPHERGIAVAFAAAGYTAGWEDATRPYDRDDTDPVDPPLPAGVEGHQLGGRR